jgi:hypothetical protein
MSKRSRRAPSAAAGPSLGRDLVFVLGPPRSGTSAVAHVLEGLGVSFGERDRFVDATANSHNPVFFELRSLNDLNAEIIRTGLGFEYADFSRPALPTDYAPDRLSSYRDRIIELIRSELADAPVVGLKDPRFAYTLPFWVDAATSAGFRCRCVVTDRAVDASSASNRQVNGFPEAHNTRIVVLSQMMCAWQVRSQVSALVTYDALLSHPEEGAAALAGFLGLPSDRAGDAARVLDGGLRHQRAEPGSTSPVSLDGALLSERSKVYSTLLGLLDSTGLNDLLAERLEVLAELSGTTRPTGVDGAGGRPAILDLLDQRVERETARRLAAAAADSELERRRRAAASDGAVTAQLWTAASAAVLASSAQKPRLYLAEEGADFSEGSALDGTLSATAAGVLARFGPFDAMSAARLRFDPDVAPGVYTVTSIIVAGRDLSHVFAEPAATSGLLLPMPGGGGLTFLCDHEDPWIELSIPVDGSVDGPFEVEVGYRRETLLSLAEMAQRRIAAETVAANASRLSDAERELGRRLDEGAETLTRQVQSALSSLEARAESTTEALSTTAARLAEAEQRLVERLEARTSALASQIQATATALEARSASMAEALAGTEARLAEAEQRLGGRLQKQASALASQLQGAVSRLEAGDASNAEALAATAARLADTERRLREQLDERTTAIGRDLRAALSRAEVAATAIAEAQSEALAAAMADTAERLRASEDRLARQLEAQTSAAAADGMLTRRHIASLEAENEGLRTDLRRSLEASEQLLRWARHRSPGYWWQQFRSLFHR